MTREEMIDQLVCCGAGLDQRDAEVLLDANLNGVAIAQLLAWGVAVATAEMVDKRRPELFAPAFYDGYNSRLEVLRTVTP